MQKMQLPHLITFLSDFGTEDGYAGSVKGIIKSLSPGIEIIDIAHEIKPFRITQAAWTILNYYTSYPEGTVHLVVVDPGVGGKRNALILQTNRYYFVGPDNGLFRFVKCREAVKAFRLNAEQGSHYTFQGRDIFAPAAAKLADGLSPGELGKALPDWKSDKEPLFTVSGNMVLAKAIAVDHFGNIISGFSADDMKNLKFSVIESLRVKNFRITKINKFYAERKTGEMLALWNSQNFLEIAVNSGSAARQLSFDLENDKIFIEVK